GPLIEEDSQRRFSKQIINRGSRSDGRRRVIAEPGVTARARLDLPESALPRTRFDRVEKSDTLGRYGPLFVNRRAVGPGRLKVHQRIGSSHAGERTRATFIGPHGRLRRAADCLFPVAGRGRPGRTDPSDRGRDGSGLPPTHGPAGPSSGRRPQPLRLWPLGTPPTARL